MAREDEDAKADELRAFLTDSPDVHSSIVESVLKALREEEIFTLEALCESAPLAEFDELGVKKIARRTR